MQNSGGDSVGEDIRGRVARPPVQVRARSRSCSPESNSTIGHHRVETEISRPMRRRPALIRPSTRERGPGRRGMGDDVPPMCQLAPTGVAQEEPSPERSGMAAARAAGVGSADGVLRRAIHGSAAADGDADWKCARARLRMATGDGGIRIHPEGKLGTSSPSPFAPPGPIDGEQPRLHTQRAIWRRSLASWMPLLGGALSYRHLPFAQRCGVVLLEIPSSSAC